MILKEIQQSIEAVTGEPLKGNLDNKKIFCGLARKHDNASQSKIAEYLQIFFFFFFFFFSPPPL